VLVINDGFKNLYFVTLSVLGRAASVEFGYLSTSVVFGLTFIEILRGL
jgi:hypothetical protein